MRKIHSNTRQPYRGRVNSTKRNRTLDNMESGEQDLEPAAKLYFNAQSLASKLDELSASVVINNPDIIIITETWCNFNIADSILTINGYFIEPNLRID